MERLGLAPKPSNPTPVVAGDNLGIAGQQVHIGTINMPKSRRGRRAATPGLIEAAPDMRTYSTYLVGKYIAWRKKGMLIDKRSFDPSSAHGILSKGFGSVNSVLLISQERFFDWIKQAQAKIDGTVFGQRNLRNRKRNYHTWKEHLIERHGS